MTQHLVPSSPSRPAAAVQIRWQALRSEASGTLLEGVAAQDALAALFDESAAERPSDASKQGRHQQQPK